MEIGLIGLPEFYIHIPRQKRIGCAISVWVVRRTRFFGLWRRTLLINQLSIDRPATWVNRKMHSADPPVTLLPEGSHQAWFRSHPTTSWRNLSLWPSSFFVGEKRCNYSKWLPLLSDDDDDAHSHYRGVQKIESFTLSLPNIPDFHLQWQNCSMAM